MSKYTVQVYGFWKYKIEADNVDAACDEAVNLAEDESPDHYETDCTEEWEDEDED